MTTIMWVRGKKSCGRDLLPAFLSQTQTRVLYDIIITINTVFVIITRRGGSKNSFFITIIIIIIPVGAAK